PGGLPRCRRLRALRSFVLASPAIVVTGPVAHPDNGDHTVTMRPPAGTPASATAGRSTQRRVTAAGFTGLRRVRRRPLAVTGRRRCRCRCEARSLAQDAGDVAVAAAYSRHAPNFPN